MAPFPYTAYLTTLAAARRAAPLVAKFSPEVARGLADRANSALAFTAWARGHRDPSRPLVVLHGASAGELRQGEPVVQRLRRRHPEWQLAVTCSSPSGIPVARSLAADAVGFLPFDLKDEVTSFLDALAPTAIVVVKLDLWPTLARVARARGIRLGLIAGRVRPGSGRLGWVTRSVLGPGYQSLDLVGATSPDDAERLIRLGARPEAIRVLGDPRYDAVLERVAGRPAPSVHPTTLVAGSTWPRDEILLLRVLARLTADGVDARLVLAPHQPRPGTLARLASWAATLGLPEPRPLTHAEQSDQLVLVEEVGNLAFLYGAGGIAYVGGGFRPGGLHSVLEPAVWGVPVIAGPDARANPEATALFEAGGLACLPERRPGRMLEGTWRTWLTDSDQRRRAGQAARETLTRGTGAADRSVELVERLVGR